jgi:predicted nucleic acid-binding protein
MAVDKCIDLVTEDHRAFHLACFREWARLITGKSSVLIEDEMIAATARVHGSQVATRNERDFGDLQVRVFNPFEFRE